MMKVRLFASASLLLWTLTTGSVFGSGAQDLLGYDFYHNASETEDGPVVTASVSMNHDGLFALGNLLLREENLINAFSTGYNGSIGDLSFSLSYDLSQFADDSQSLVYSSTNLTMQYDVLRFDYLSTETGTMSSWSVRQDVLGFNLSAYLKQYFDEIGPDETTFRERRQFKLYRYFGPLRLQHQISQSDIIRRDVSSIRYDFNNHSRLTFYTSQYENTHNYELSFATEVMKNQLSFHVNQTDSADYLMRRVHSVRLQRNWDHLRMEMIFNDSANYLQGSAVLLKYYRVFTL